MTEYQRMLQGEFSILSGYHTFLEFEEWYSWVLDQQPRPKTIQEAILQWKEEKVLTDQQ